VSAGETVKLMSICLLAAMVKIVAQVLVKTALCCLVATNLIYMQHTVWLPVARSICRMGNPALALSNFSERAN